MGIGFISWPATTCSKGSTLGSQVCLKDHFCYVYNQGQKSLYASQRRDTVKSVLVIRFHCKVEWNRNDIKPTASNG